LTPERWARIKDIYIQALELPERDRQDFLRSACRHDPSLLNQLEILVASNEPSENSPDNPAPAAVSRVFSPGQLVAGRYSVLRLIGRGGMGEVYEVDDQEIGERVALKVIHSSLALEEKAIQRFRLELRLSRAITHPNVCRVFDIGHHRDGVQEVIFLTMEFLEGETLEARLAREKPLKPDCVLPLVRQICEGLTSAHDRGIVHGDLKTANVILVRETNSTRAVLADFGLARVIKREGESVSSLFSSRQLAGTPSYLAPEQLEGSPPSRSTDIYALGVLLYEVAAGRKPFVGESIWATTMRRLTEQPPPPRVFASSLPPHWSDAILRCLARRPEDRFASALDVYQYFVSPPVYRRVPVLWAACAILAMMLCGLLLWMNATHH
jgi:serine/threonine protein kinase